MRFLTVVFCAISATLIACGDGTLSTAKQTETVSLMAMPPKAVSGLKTPESVVQTPDGRIFVTEINGFNVDGDGQVTVIEQGVARVFVSGLDDPKGIIAKNADLYLTDKTKVLKINAQGKVTVFADANAFPSPPVFLNDIELDTLGNLYVSDSGDLNEIGRGAAIYKIDPQGKVSLVINSITHPLLRAPNGLLMDDTGAVISFVDFASGVLYSYDMAALGLTEQATGFGGADGLVHHSSGAMFVSDWKNGKVFMIDALEGQVTEIKSSYKAAADIALTKDEQYLMVPDFKAGTLDFIAVSNFIK